VNTKKRTVARGLYSLALTFAAVALGACAGRGERCENRMAAWRLGEAETRPDARRGRDEVQGHAGGSWSLVFNGPTVNRALAGTEPREFAEYSRNDGALSYRNDGPLLASSEWPERERASLAYSRRVYLDPRADQLLFFENESKYRGSSGYRSAPVVPGDGLWGFWR
jgi:hypothetical protein